MSNDTDEINMPVVQDELTALKARADQLGLAYHPSIGVDKLREKVNVAMTAAPGTQAVDEPVEAVASTPVPESDGQKRLRLKSDAIRLVRIRVTCMNPAKKDWTGEIFTTGNAVIGSVKKFVPFNAEEGWHVPNVILEMIKQRQCQIFVDGKKDRMGVSGRTGKLIKEFGVEILDDLTDVQIKELAQRQAMAGGVG